jgi:hypothetical protein
MKFDSVIENFVISCENYTKKTNALCKRNARILIDKTCGTLIDTGRESVVFPFRVLGFKS